jgi:hypothetical protein
MGRWLLGCSAARLLGCSAARLLGCSAARRFSSRAAESPSRYSSHCADIAPTGLGERRQLLVGVTFFVEGALEDFRLVREAEHVGKGADAAVSGDLVVLDALRRGDDRGVERFTLVVLLEKLVALGEQAFHSLALVAAGFLTELREHLLEAVDVLSRLHFVLLECTSQIGVRRGFRHFRKRLQDLLLGAVEILELFHVDVLQRLAGHGVPPACGELCAPFSRRDTSSGRVGRFAPRRSGAGVSPKRLDANHKSLVRCLPFPEPVRHTGRNLSMSASERPESYDGDHGAAAERLRIAIRAVLDGSGSTEGLHAAARELVSELRQADEPPEQALVRIKQTLAEAGLRPGYASSDGGTQGIEATVYRDVIAWSIRQYYGATS